MDIIEPTYLPFSSEQLEKHFAPGHSKDAKKYLPYYLNSVKRYKEYVSADKVGVTIGNAKHLRQVEKDERFWIVTCLLSYYYSDNRNDLFSKLLSATFGEKPPIDGFSSWEECLEGNLQLYFEVTLPSPKSYEEWLAENTSSRHVIPYVLEASRHKSGKETRLDLEGATRVDALLINPDTNFAIIFEAKVLSDISCGITFDAMRNQIIRNIDVMLEDNKKMPEPLSLRLPDRTLFVLLTPQMFKDNLSSRYYGFLYNEYKKDLKAIKRDLPHRTDEDLHLVDRRIGWLTWEQCEAQFPGSCPWLKLKLDGVQLLEENS